MCTHARILENLATLQTYDLVLCPMSTERRRTCSGVLPATTGPCQSYPTLLEEAIYVCSKYLSVRDIVLPDPKANIIDLLFQIYTTILTR